MTTKENAGFDAVKNQGARPLSKTARADLPLNPDMPIGRALLVRGAQS